VKHDYNWKRVTDSILQVLPLAVEDDVSFLPLKERFAALYLQSKKATGRTRIVCYLDLSINSPIGDSLLAENPTGLLYEDAFNRIYAQPIGLAS
jgi:hypothetical protein